MRGDRRPAGHGRPRRRPRRFEPPCCAEVAAHPAGAGAADVVRTAPSQPGGRYARRGGVAAGRCWPLVARSPARPGPDRARPAERPGAAGGGGRDGAGRPDGDRSGQGRRSWAVVVSRRPAAAAFVGDGLARRPPVTSTSCGSSTPPAPPRRPGRSTGAPRVRGVPLMAAPPRRRHPSDSPSSPDGGLAAARRPSLSSPSRSRPEPTEGRRGRPRYAAVSCRCWPSRA